MVELFSNYEDTTTFFAVCQGGIATIFVIFWKIILEDRIVFY
jgi:hypothetical protein